MNDAKAPEDVTKASLPIDVVIPAFNSADHLAETLESISAQTVAPRMTIVVDDGSTDETAFIARSFGATVIEQPNRGQSDARNTGIRAAQAPYIALLDSDDRWHPERLAAQWTVIEQFPATKVIGSDYSLWKDGVVGPPVLANHKSFRSAGREQISKDAFVVDRQRLVQALVKGNFLLPSSLLVARHLFADFDLYFLSRDRVPQNDNVFVGEDYEWTLRLLRHTDVTFVDRSLVDYRSHEKSLSARSGRLIYGDTVIATLVLQNPDVYAPNAAEGLARNRPRTLWLSAGAHLRAGEIEIVRERMRELRTAGSVAMRPVFHVLYELLRFPWVRRASLAIFRGVRCALGRFRQR